jgi:hypothetical protein
VQQSDKLVLVDEGSLLRYRKLDDVTLYSCGLIVILKEKTLPLRSSLPLDDGLTLSRFLARLSQCAVKQILVWTFIVLDFLP